MDERVAIAGSGAIACGLAAVAAVLGDVRVLARSEQSARRAALAIDTLRRKIGEEPDAGQVIVTTELPELADATFLVEAVAEDPAVKGDVIAALASIAGESAIIATTTSSLSIAALAHASGNHERFAGLHVFNPVPRMELVEVAFPPGASEETKRRTVRLCHGLGKRAVVVPDTPGFVVNRLLFPYLFSAVELLEQTGLPAESVDRCMTLGAGHPMGPLELLDFVGLDVAAAIGEALERPVPASLTALVDAGALGRKSGRGFYAYEEGGEARGQHAR